MDNQSCDIIQDLLPLYIDGVCSAASKALIKEHLLTCEKCRDTEKIYRENAFTAEKIEIKQIDGLKKIKAKHNQLYYSIAACGHRRLYVYRKRGNGAGMAYVSAVWNMYCVSDDFGVVWGKRDV